jgi:putative hemolysin
MRNLIVLLLAGCASTSEVVPYGSGVYLITAKSNSGTASRWELQAMAAKEANAYCGKQGKTMQVKEDTAIGNVWTGTASRLLFTCADK